MGAKEVELQFLGATQEVTGSCFLLTVGAKKLLVECGMVQGGNHRSRLTEGDHFPFDPSEIDAVVLTHAHLDHSGALPLLVKSGFKGPIHTHFATRDLCEILLLDAGYLSEKDAEVENHKRERKHLAPIEPLYTVEDAKQVLPRFECLPYQQRQEILPGITICLQDAGHILGAAIVEIWLQEKGLKRKLVFSGDLGHHDMPILEEPTIISEADLVVMESTYGNRQHRSWDETWEEMKAIFHEASQHKGNILIPSFAVGRAQELLYIFRQYFDEWHLGNWKIFLDSPMAIEATKVYAKHWHLYDEEAKNIAVEEGSPYRLPNLHISKTSRDSMNLNRFTSGAMIIAGSGMCTGGRIKHHLKHNVWRKNCHILIVGFQAQGTLGRALVDGADEITLWGETIKVAAKIHTVGGFSAHADQRGLLNWYGHFSANPRLALVHGEKTAIKTLAQRIYEDFTVHALVPEFGEKLDLKTWQSH